MNVVRGVYAVLKDLVVGDDWRMIVGVVVLLMLVAGLVGLGIPAWWLLPLGAVALLAVGVVSDPPSWHGRSGGGSQG